MDSVIASVAGTRTLLAARLDRLCFGWSAHIVQGGLFVLLIGSLIQSGDPRPFLVALVLLLFSQHILRRFIDDVLAKPLPGGAEIGNPSALLSLDVVRHLVSWPQFSAGGLVEAAAKSERGAYMLREMDIDPADFMKRCSAVIDGAVDVVSFLREAVDRMRALGEECIDANVILLLLFERMPACRDILHAADLSTEDLAGIVQWEAFHHHFRLCNASLDPEALRRAGSVGRSWVMGYTDALDWLTEELPAEKLPCGEGNVIVHGESIDALLHVLSRSNLRNTLLLGKAGVGKRSLIRNAACALREHERKNHLPFTRVLLLKTQQLLSGVQNSDTFLLRAFDRARSSGNFLIVIEDLAVFLKSANERLRAVFLKFLQARTIAVVGIADIQDYHALVKTDPTLDSLFEKITVEDTTDADTMRVLMARYFSVASRSGMTVTYKAMCAILELSKRYLNARGGFPGKTIDVLDDVLLRAKASGIAIVREEHVREIISVRSRVNVQRMGEQEKERLLNLEEIMRRRVIGQEWAVKAVVNSLKRARLDIGTRKRPIGTFLFLGPTGVGKTQTAKVLAEEYFGSTQAIIRLDMNEFSHDDSASGIAGTVSGGAESYLAQRVQDNPFSLILLDEIEKAHPKVLNVFLQILDEGMLTDARGLKTDFRNTIIIATSNAGALFIREYLKAHPEYDRDDFKKALLDAILRDRIFTPEFVNRFDDSVLFTPLNPASAVQVGQLMLGEVIADIEHRRGIHVSIEADLMEQLVERGYSVEFGARELRRTITDMVEDYLADYLLKNDVKRGETIVIKKADLKW